MEEVSIEEALVIAKEIGESLGGRQQRALEVLCRAADRRRITGQHQAVTAFRTATEIAKKAAEGT